MHLVFIAISKKKKIAKNSSETVNFITVNICYCCMGEKGVQLIYHYSAHKQEIKRKQASSFRLQR